MTDSINRILCFGDSNTWGYNPKDGSRFSSQIRWTGILQELLGPQFLVIEEGLNGRTTAFDYRDRVGKNGLAYLIPCLDSHFPLNTVIICLGTNDTKVEFNHSVETIAAGLERCLRAIRGEGGERPSPSVRLIVAAPVLVAEAHIAGYGQLVGSEEKTRKLPSLYRELAKKYGAEFVDLSAKVSPSVDDGCHLDPATHRQVAEIFYSLLRKSDVAR